MKPNLRSLVAVAGTIVVLSAPAADRGFFGLSEPGAVTVEPDGFTRFTPKKDGRDRFLKLDAVQRPRVREALVQLSSQPPRPTGK